MKKASQIPHSENWDFDRVLREADHPREPRRRIKVTDRIPYAYTRLERELKDAKNRKRKQ